MHVCTGGSFGGGLQADAASPSFVFLTNALLLTGMPLERRQRPPSFPRAPNMKVRQCLAQLLHQHHTKPLCKQLRDKRSLQRKPRPQSLQSIRRARPTGTQRVIRIGGLPRLTFPQPKAPQGPVRGRVLGRPSNQGQIPMLRVANVLRLLGCWLESALPRISSGERWAEI